MCCYWLFVLLILVVLMSWIVDSVFVAQLVRVSVILLPFGGCISELFYYHNSPFWLVVVMS